MPEYTLIPITQLPHVPGTWDLTWPLAIGDPATDKAYQANASELAEKLVQDGAFADIRNTKYYVAGRGNPGDPAPGDSSIIDSTLQGYTFTSVVLRNVGPLIPGQEYFFNNLNKIDFFSQDPGNPGPYNFNNGDVIVVTFEPKISSIVATPGSIGKGYAGVKYHTESGNILPDDFQKLQQIVATTAPVDLVLPPGADYPPGVRLTVVTNMVNTYQSKITAAGTDKILLTPGGVSGVILGFNDQLTVVWNDDGAGVKGWYVDYISPSYQMVGGLIFSYVPPMNAVLLDGSQISKIQYPRGQMIIDKLQELYLDAVVDFATWNSDPFKHRTKWAAEPGSDIIIKPDWRGLFVRALPEDRPDIDQDRGADKNVPGSFEKDAGKIHNHVKDPKFNKLGAKASDLDGGGTPGSLDSKDPENEYRVGYMKGPGYDLWPNATMQDAGESEYENRSINGGLPAYCFI